MKCLYNGCNKCLIKSCCTQICESFIKRVKQKFKIDFNGMKNNTSRELAIEVGNQIIESDGYRAGYSWPLKIKETRMVRDRRITTFRAKERFQERFQLTTVMKYQKPNYKR